MRKIIVILLSVFALGLISCSPFAHGPYEGDTSDYAGNPIARLIISGHVTNTANEPLQGIYISVPNVREPNEKDILSYNYAITDSLGKYLIIRYRGRELPTDVTVVATDSTGFYREQYCFSPVKCDSIEAFITPLSSPTVVPNNVFVEANFVLSALSQE